MLFHIPSPKFVFMIFKLFSLQDEP